MYTSESEADDDDTLDDDMENEDFSELLDKDEESAFSQTLQVVPYRELSALPANNCKFYELCEVLENSRLEHGKVKKVEIITKFLQNFEGTNIYPLIRLIISQFDTERKNYRLKEKNLGRIYFNILRIQEERLKHFSDPQLNETTGILNDTFPLVIQQIFNHSVSVKSSSSSSSTITCGQINNYLNKIYLTKSIKECEKLISNLIHKENMRSGLEHSWFCRILLKSLYLVRLDRYSLLNNLYSNTSLKVDNGIHYYGDLRRTLSIASFHSTSNPMKFSIELFSPFRPMLPQRFEERDLEQLNDFIIEEKFDGDRVLIHIDNIKDEIKLFSRNQNDHSIKFGGNYFFNLVKRSIQKNVNKCILDGELVVFDNENKKLLRNGSWNSPSCGKEMKKFGEKGRLVFYYYIFDLVYLERGMNNNNTTNQDEKQDETKRSFDLTKYPLHVRKSLLNEIYVQDNPYIRLVPTLATVSVATDKTENYSQIKKVLMEEIIVNYRFNERKEGIVLKAINSPYCVAPKTRDWIKIKPDYLDELNEGFDLIILGGIYGNCKREPRAESICSVHKLIVGYRENNDENSYIVFGKPIIYNPGRIIRARISKQFEDYGIPTKSKQPTHFEHEYCSVWLKPENSLIVEVTGTQMLEDSFRFPRIKKIRDDKNYWECATRNDVRERLEVGYSSFKFQNFSTSTFGASKSIKKQKRSHTYPTTAVSTYLPPFLANLQYLNENQRNLFQGKTFLVCDNKYHIQKMNVPQFLLEAPHQMPILEKNLSIGRQLDILKEKDRVDEEEIEISQNHLEDLIQSFGGTIQKQTFKDFFFTTSTDDCSTHQQCYHISSGRSSVRTRNQIDRNLNCPDLLSIIWLFDCLRVNRVLSPNKYEDYGYVNVNQRDRTNEDQFSDSFTEFASLESLAKSMHLVKSSKNEKREKMSNDDWFTSAVIYFFDMDIEERWFHQERIERHGGRIRSTLENMKKDHDIVTHIVVSNSFDLTILRANIARFLISNHIDQEQVVVVKEEWINKIYDSEINWKGIKNEKFLIM